MVQGTFPVKGIFVGQKWFQAWCDTTTVDVGKNWDIECQFKYSEWSNIWPDVIFYFDILKKLGQYIFR